MITDIILTEQIAFTRNISIHIYIYIYIIFLFVLMMIENIYMYIHGGPF